MPDPQQTVLPPASPVQSPDDQLKQQMLQQSQMGSQAFAQEMARRQQLSQQLGQLQQQRGNLPVPPMGYQPQMQPMTGQGFGRDVGNVFGNIGKALLTGAAATVPGQAIQSQVYGPGVREYQAKAGSLAEQIAEIQKQMGPESEAMQAATGMTYRPMMGYGNVQRGEAAVTAAGAKVMSAQTQQIHEQHQFGLQNRLADIKQQLGQGKLNQEQARTQAMMAIADENNATKRDVAAQITDAQQRDTDVKAVDDLYKTNQENWIKNALGLGATQQPTIVPRTNQPGKPQAKPAAGVGKGVIRWGRDAQGNPVRLSR